MSDTEADVPEEGESIEVYIYLIVLNNKNLLYYNNKIIISIFYRNKDY